MPQYGEIRVDYITYTTGVSPEANRTVTVSSLVGSPTFTGDVVVGGDLNVTGEISAGNNVTITGNLGVSGDTTLNNVTITGDIIAENISTTGTLNVESGVFGSGSAANPSITFTGDLDTGIYTSSGNHISFTTNGTHAFDIDESGNIDTGNEIIGANFYTRPDRLFSDFGQNGKTRISVNRDLDPISNNSQGGFIEGFVGQTDTYQAFYITSSGRIAINGTDPRMDNATPSVNIFSYAEGLTAPRLAVTDIRATGVSTLSPGYIFGCPSGAFGEVLGLLPSGSGIEAGSVGIRAGGINSVNEKLTVLGNTPVEGYSGGVGINTVRPTSKLMVNDIGRTKAFYDTTLDSSVFICGGTVDTSGSFGGSIGFGRHNSTTRKVAEIVTKQHTTDNDQCGLSFFVHPSTNTNSSLVEALTINHLGYVGINETSPSGQFIVHDSAAANDTPEIIIKSFRPALRFDDKSGGQVDSEICGDNSLRFRVAIPESGTGGYDEALVERLRISNEGALTLFASGSTITSNSDNFGIRRELNKTTHYNIRQYGQYRDSCSTVVANQFIMTSTLTGTETASGVNNIYGYDCIGGTVTSGAESNRVIGYHCSSAYGIAAAQDSGNTTFATFLNLNQNNDNAWNVFAAGAAPNFMNGNLGIGATRPNTRLSIGTTTNTSTGTFAGLTNHVAYMGFGSTETNNFGGIVVGAGQNGNSPYIAASRAVGGQYALPLSLITDGEIRQQINAQGNHDFIPEAGGACKISPNALTQSPTICLMRPLIPNTASGITIAFDTIGINYLGTATATTMYHYRARGGDSLPSGKTLNYEVAFYADPRSTKGENNYAFKSDYTFTSKNWNLYVNGTADNYFAGKCGIGIQRPNAGVHCSSSNSDTASIISQVTQTQATHTNKTLKVRNNSSSSTFEVSFLGNIYASNTTVQPISSERRLKDNIVEFDASKSWDVVKGLQIREYNYLETPDQTLQGYIVDEVEPIDSSLVVDTGKEDEVGPIRSYNNSKVIAHYHSALKQALARIEDLEDRLSKLESK